MTPWPSIGRNALVRWITTAFCALLPADDLHLRRVLARVLPGSDRQPESRSTTIARGPGMPRLALHAMPVVVRDAGFGVGHVAARVLIVDPAAKPRIGPEHVAGDPRPYPSGKAR